MADFNKFHKWTTNLGIDVNLQTDVLGALLTNVEPSATNSVKADIAEITAENGYPAGGPDIAIVSYNDNDIPGVAELVNDSASVIAAGGTVGPFKHAVLYDKTALNQPLIGWYTYPIEILLADTEQVDIIFDDGQGNGTLTIGP